MHTGNRFCRLAYVSLCKSGLVPWTVLRTVSNSQVVMSSFTAKWKLFQGSRVDCWRFSLKCQLWFESQSCLSFWRIIWEIRFLHCLSLCKYLPNWWTPHPYLGWKINGWLYTCLWITYFVHFFKFFPNTQTRWCSVPLRYQLPYHFAVVPTTVPLSWSRGTDYKCQILSLWYYRLVPAPPWYWLPVRG